MAKNGMTSVEVDVKTSCEVDVNVDELLDSASDDAIKEEYQERFGVPASVSDRLDDLRKAFAEQDKMHFDVLIDRMLQDAGCA